jgi:hypothetical protein
MRAAGPDETRDDGAEHNERKQCDEHDEQTLLTSSPARYELACRLLRESLGALGRRLPAPQLSESPARPGGT